MTRTRPLPTTRERSLPVPAPRRARAARHITAPTTPEPTVEELTDAGWRSTWISALAESA